MAVAGVDACAGRWIAVVLDDAGRFAGVDSALKMVDLVDAISTGLREVGDVLRVAAVDIPIGLPTDEYRAADVAARGSLGSRRSSLFLTPTRAALQEPDYARANAINRRLTGGTGISRQAYALRDRIFDVDAWLATGPSLPVIEVHPELSFRHLAGAPMKHSKKTWAGMQARRAGLIAAGIDIPADLGRAREVAAVDDVLDAAVAAWSGLRFLRGAATRYPTAAGDETAPGSVIWA
jgi:predicted RNase H-like nuclease